MSLYRIYEGILPVHWVYQLRNRLRLGVGSGWTSGHVVRVLQKVESNQIRPNRSLKVKISLFGKHNLGTLKVKLITSSYGQYKDIVDH